MNEISNFSQNINFEEEKHPGIQLRYSRTIHQFKKIQGFPQTKSFINKIEIYKNFNLIITGISNILFANKEIALQLD